MKKITKKDIERVKIQFSGYSDCCLVMCIALLFNCTTKDIPWNLLEDNKGWSDRLIKWSVKKGYYPVLVHHTKTKRKKQFLEHCKENFPFYYVLGGQTKAQFRENKGKSHAILYKGDKEIFDPMYKDIPKKKFTKKGLDEQTIKHDLDVMFFVPIIPKDFS